MKVAQRAASPGSPSLKGFVEAVRPHTEHGWEYVVQVCSEGIGYDCPGAYLASFHEGELQSTGELFRPCTYFRWKWPPPSVPRFEYHEVVRLSGRGHLALGEAGQAAVVWMYPNFHPRWGWLYTIRLYPGGSETYRPIGSPLHVKEDALLPTGALSRYYWLERSHPPRFAICELVKICAPMPQDAAHRGRVVPDVNREQDDDGAWRYTILDDHDDLVQFPGAELAPTGEFEPFEEIPEPEPDDEASWDRAPSVRLLYSPRHLVGADGIRRYPCRCCSYYTLNSPSPGTEATCPICGWEDSLVQAIEVDNAGGPNHVSLREARENFAECGAATLSHVKYARPPKPDEIPPASA